MSELRGRNSRGRAHVGRGVDPRMQWGLIAAVTVISLFGAVTWLVNLERELPEIRTPRDLSSSSVLTGHALMMPGEHSIGDVDGELTGDWVSQEIGESAWMATDLQGSRLRAAFYGTDAYMIVRMGPDATRAYVSVNGLPVEHLAQDELGSYVNLWSGETSDQPVLLARNLAHGEHVVEVVAAGDGELALSGFDIVASTPFLWAFVLGYAGLGGGLFLVLRSILYSLNQRSSAAITGRSHSSRTPGR
jgi:hypothetical protein